MSAALEDAVRGGAITLCRCWRVTRRDGGVLGFTDHDEPLAFGGTLFEVATGADSAVAERKLGLSVEDTEVSGALASPSLTEADIASGRYDDARVELFVVDWTDPALHRRMADYTIGEIVRSDGAFRAELRGSIERLERSNARRFTRHCDAELGDRRCGVDLARPGLRHPTRVIALDGTRLRVEAVGGADDGLFDHGHVEWRSGANAGTRSAIVRSRAEATDRGGGRVVALWEAPNARASPGDDLVLVAGCDKSFATCWRRYSNASNFRGFPHLPDGDSAFRYATIDGLHDGGPLVP